MKPQSAPAIYFGLFSFIVYNWTLLSCYLIIIDVLDKPGTVIFNSSVNDLELNRQYNLNSYKNAHFIKNLFHVNQISGQVILKTYVKCEGIQYPNLFSFYVESITSSYHINYYSLHLRAYIIGENCNNDGNRLSKNIYHFDLSTVQKSLIDKKIESKESCLTNSKTSRTSYSQGRNLYFSNNKLKILQSISDITKRSAETSASYAIHSTWNQMCLKKSQMISNLNNFLPQTVREHCLADYISVSDFRVMIESLNQDLVASRNICISEPMWKVLIILKLQCSGLYEFKLNHRLEIIYHQHQLNTSDFVKRVRRELKNQSPFFEQSLYVAAVLEEEAEGKVITTVQARDPENSPILYSMTSLIDSRSQSMFKIDLHTGVVTNLKSLDRELMDVHYFQIVATDDSFPPRSGTTTLQVNVLDCNDNYPIFEAECYDATIREGSPIGTAIIAVRAIDHDIGKNAKIEYAIESINGDGISKTEDLLDTFRVDSETGVISVLKTLDREEAEVYTVIVIASDSPNLRDDKKSATGTVIITILDENDNHPEFVLKIYDVQIREDVWDSKAIAHIKAHDKDQGNNAAIRYSIIGGNVQSQFSIDSTTGEIFLSKPLDFEAVQNFRLVIRAQDGGNPSRSNTTQLLVQVIDVNDNSPRFFVTHFQETVLENVPIGYNVLRVQAYDPDQGINADIRYNIMEYDEHLPLTVDEKTGWIQTIKQLDREACSNFALKVIAVDRGKPPRSASANVVITIQDVNDNDPLFQPKYYEAVISEDLPPGSSVLTVTAVDPDENSRLHYDIISGNTRARFGVSVQNGKGVITLTQPLDYKQENRFLLTIAATDAGGRSDSAYININVTDANNYAPTFENSPYSAAVMEDVPIGTTVLIITATDNDVGINAQITYSLQEPISGIERSVPFAINSKTGAITTLFSLNRELTSAYFLSVKASDGGYPSFSDTTDIEIVITDVNDNTPRFTASLYQASVSEDAVVGTSIIQVCAEDADIGINGQIIYSFSNTDIIDGSFVIDSISGTLRTSKILDRESVESYSIFIIATDKGTPSLSSSVEVQITLEDVNDSPPSFSVDKITLYIEENSPIGSIVGTIEAHDPDEGVNAIVQYSIIGGEDAIFFSLMSRSETKGVQLLLMTELDYESPKKYFELVVRAASPPLKTDVQVDILVTDINDNAPILKNFQVFFNNYPGKFPIAEIGHVPAFDADVTDELSFTIISGNNAKFIRVNDSSGEITLCPQLNTNVPMHVFMEISVTDGINEVKATMQLIVRLVSDKMLYNSVTVRLNEITEESFLSPLLEVFVNALAIVIPCPKDNIFLFSVKKDDQISNVINVSFSALRTDVHNDEFFTAKYLLERMYLNRAIVANLVGIAVLPLDDVLCVREPCLNFEECHTFLKFAEASSFIHSDTVLFRSIHPVNTFACRCPEGFTGSKEHYLCDTEIDLCYSNPCHNHGQCSRREGGFSCICKEGYVGTTCEFNFANLKRCGNHSCETIFSCAVSDTDPNFLNYTQTCGLKSRYFSNYSFITFDTLQFRHRFKIKLSFATLEYHGLLFYNGRHSESDDFIALEIVDGRISFSFSLGNSKHIVQFQRGKKVSDGLWHTVEVIYFNRTATVVIDECDKALKNLEGKRDCVNQTTLMLDKKCSTPTVPCYRFLDFTGPFQVGGLSTFSKNSQVKTKHFEGCISNILIDHRFLDFNAFASENGTMVGCPQKALYCKFEPCFNGGTCIEGWNRHFCHCPQGYTGSACQEITYLPWRFLKNSVLSFNPLLRPIQLPWNFGFSIRTLKKTSFVMQIHIGQNSTVITSLKNGFLILSYDAEDLYFPKFHLADGKWHRIDVNWSSSTIKVSIDYRQRVEIRSISKNIQGHFFGKVVFGSIPDTFINDQDHYFYEGCIQDLRIGGIQNVLNLPSVRENVEDGCLSKVKCPKSCPKKSSCVQLWDEANCECLPGYIGRKCDPVCAFNPCNLGICHTDLQKLNFYRCECNHTSYFGENCEHVIELPCPSGWWGKKVCGPCKCDTNKGYNANCNKVTGECKCTDNHYQPVGETFCYPCDCYPIGSFETKCNILTGQCACKDGVIGRRCDSCTSPYAEVTYSGCEVVYDVCPRSYSEGIWWNRTPLGQLALQDCPEIAEGKASRICDSNSGRWKRTDLFNCTSRPLLELKNQLLRIRKHELELNSFLSIKLVHKLKDAIGLVIGIATANVVGKILTTREFTHNRVLEDAFKPLNNINSFPKKLFGNDILIIDGLLHQIIHFEQTLRGLNMSHTQDKHFVRNLVFITSSILSKKYTLEWRRINVTLHRGPQDLVEVINQYMTLLAESQHETFGMPFEVVHENMILGFNIISFGTLNFTNANKRNEDHESNSLEFINEAKNIKSPHNLYSTIVLSEIPIISFPKLNNYMQDKMKFDKLTKVRLPIGTLKENTIFDNDREISDYHAIVTYAQYKDAGALFPERYDGTISRRWGVNLSISSALLSLVVLVPSSRNISNTNKGRDHILREKELVKEESLIDKSQIQIVSNGNHNSSSQNGSVKIYNKKLLKEDTHTRISKRHSTFSNVFFMEYRNLDGETLTNPIQLQLLMDINGSQFEQKLNPQCVRWNKVSGCWTRLGCQTEIPNVEFIKRDRKFFVNCTCNIMSTYAVLVDMSAIDDIIEPYGELQWAMNSAFLSSLSILAVVITLLISTRGKKTNSNSIHQNMVICVFLAELLVFIGMQARISLSYNEFMCKFIAISFHYLWLAAFAWVTVDCFHLYRMLTEMRDINHGPMCFYCSLGFGAPAILVGLSVGVRAQEYGNNLFCGLSLYEPVIWWLVVPVCSMVGVSLYLLFMCIKNAFALKDHILQFGSTRKLILLSVILLPIMGVLLLLTLLSTSKKSQILTILLCIVVFGHATYTLVGDCILNQHVQENFYGTYLRCLGKTVPMINNSAILDDRNRSNVSVNQQVCRLGSSFDNSKRNIGISTSSTTSKSTGKTSSSACRSAEKHVSISTSHFNCVNELSNSTTAIRKISNAACDIILASSHSSDDEESKRDNKAALNITESQNPNYFPIACSTLSTTNPLVASIGQSFKHFPVIEKSAYISQWSSGVCNYYLPSQEKECHKPLDNGSVFYNVKHNVKSFVNSDVSAVECCAEKIDVGECVYETSKSRSFTNKLEGDYMCSLHASSHPNSNKKFDMMNDKQHVYEGPYEEYKTEKERAPINLRKEYNNFQNSSFHCITETIPKKPSVVGYHFPFTAEEDHVQEEPSKSNVTCANVFDSLTADVPELFSYQSSQLLETTIKRSSVENDNFLMPDTETAV